MLTQEQDIILKQIESKENQIKAIQSITDLSEVVNSINDDTEKYDLLHKVVESIIIYGTGANPLIVIHLTTGIDVYVAYYPLKKYYCEVYSTDNIYFDEYTKEGTVKAMDNTPTLNKGYYYEPAQTKLNLDQFIEYINSIDKREYLPK